MRKIHVIDYTPQDIGEAIQQLQRLHEAGKLAGMLFVCKVKHRARPVIGSAGCCSSDPVAALGAVSYLFAAVVENTFHGDN